MEQLTGVYNVCLCSNMILVLGRKILLTQEWSKECYEANSNLIKLIAMLRQKSLNFSKYMSSLNNSV